MAALGVPTAIVCLICVQLFSPTGCFTQFGQKFILTMPNSTVARSEFNIVLINPGTADLTVTSTRTSTSVSDSYAIKASNSTYVQLTGTADYLLPAYSTSNRTLVLSAEAPFGVLVYGTRAQDGYMALPVEAWGRRHVVGAFCQGYGRMCQVVVIASQNNTQVNIQFPAENLVFQSEDITHERNPINCVLDANQALVVQRPYELSGTLITSNAGVGVLAGAQWTTYEGAKGGVIEQLPPVSALGTEYVTLPQGTVRVVAVEPLTTIHFPDRKSISLTSASHCFQFKVALPTRLRADRPILVLQFGKLEATTPAANFLFLVVLTTRRQFVKSLQSTIVPFLLPNITSTLFVVTRKSYMEDIKYDSVTLNKTTQDKTSSCQFVYPDYAVFKRNIDSTSILSGDKEMAAYIQLQTADGVVLSPLTAGFSIINTLKNCNSSTPSEAGDTVDNDCDGEVDEDDCSGTPTGTDCKLTISGGRRDVWGTQFVFVIPMHVFGGEPSNVNITVAVTTLNTAQVDLHEPNRPVSTINISLYNSSYFIINPDNNTVLSDDTSMNVYRLNSSAEVSVTFFFNGRSPPPASKPTAGAMRLIPVDAFGREYYIFTPKIKSQSGYFQVVGAFPNTTVEIYLVLDPENTTVTFGGVVYRNSDVIYTRVDAYQALQISCYSACTMTGSLVSASKPVAVFSLTDLVKLAASTVTNNEDHLMEQLPPVSSYGDLFFTTYGFKNVVADPSAFDVLYVIPNQPNTTVHFENGSVTDVTLNRAGDVQELFFNFTTVVVRTSDPVLCIHVLLNLKQADAAMLVVPAVNQFTSEDIFRTVPARYPKNFHSIHLVAHSLDALGQNVTINNDAYPVRPISYLSNISVFVVHVSYVLNNNSESLHVGPWRGNFGGYVITYSTSPSLEINGLAFTLEQNSSTCNVSKQQPGDGVDNDCDGVPDEEPCLISFWNDDDSDGRYNEDCMPEVSTVSSMIDSTVISFEALDTISPTSLLEDTLSIYSTEGLSTGIEITPVLASLTLVSATLSLSAETVGLLTQDSMRSSLQIGEAVSSYSYVSTATTTHFVELTSADNIVTESTFSVTTISSSTYVSTATTTSSVEMTSSDDTVTESTFSATTMPSYSYVSTVTMTSSVDLTSDVIVASTISPTATSPNTYVSAVTTTTSAELISSQDFATQSVFSPTTVLPSSTRTTGFGSTSTPLTSSATTSRVAAPASSLCACTCPAWVHATRVDAASLASMTDSIVRELTVNKSEISAVRRKKISVPDKRQSAQTFGYFGIVVIVATCVTIVLLDSGALARDLRTLIANCSSREARS